MSNEGNSPVEDHEYFTRSKLAEYKAAGVLPLAFYSNQVLVLLGAETVRTGPNGKVRKRLWRDFGGSREAIDNDSEDTAGREFAEETLGLFAGCEVSAEMVACSAKHMANQLRTYDRVLKVVHPLRKGTYHMYVAETQYLDPLMFQLATQQNATTGAIEGAEKTAFAWVSLKALLSAVFSKTRRSSVCCFTSCSGVGRTACGRHTKPLHLHPCFASSLRMAQGSGVVTLAERICSSPLPAAVQSLPTPPAACSVPQDAAKCTGNDKKGLTSEHLLYWLLQEQVADVLGFNRGKLLQDAHLQVLCQSEEAAQQVMPGEPSQ